MRQVWTLPDEEIYRQFTPESLLTIIDGLDVDGAAKVLLLLWRTWQVRNNLTHDIEKYTIDGCRLDLIFFFHGNLVIA